MTASTADAGGDPTIFSSCFLFIIGHVGNNDEQGDTVIEASENIPSSLQLYNNSTRGVRASKNSSSGQLCIAIYVPEERRISVSDLLKHWRNSRKLYCRMRTGITLAYQLSLPCLVNGAVLNTPDARKSLPHLSARLAELTYEAESGFSAIGSSASSASSTSTGSLAAPSRQKKRGRRPSPTDLAIANSAKLYDLSKGSDLLHSALNRLVSDAGVSGWADDSALDKLNTVQHKRAPLCFTIGKIVSTAPKRTRVLGLRESSARMKAAALSLRQSATNDEADDSRPAVSDAHHQRTHKRKAEDSDETSDSEAAEDEDSHGASKSSHSPVGVFMSDSKLAQLEISMYNRDRESASRARNALAKRICNGQEFDDGQLCAATAVSSRDAVLVECNTAGEIDNRLLVERADACFTDANEFVRQRDVARVKMHRVNSCVCGSTRANWSTIKVRDTDGSLRRALCCNECGRNTAQCGVYRTDVAALKSRATGSALTRSDRRSLKHMMRAQETLRPIDSYSAHTIREAERSLRQPKRARTTPTKTTKRRESKLIDNALAHLISQRST